MDTEKIYSDSFNNKVENHRSLSAKEYEPQNTKRIFLEILSKGDVWR